MKVIDVYQQYFSAQCLFDGVARRAVSVKLTATSQEGTVRYEASVSFFPHADPEDFAVSYDACASRELYCEKGRRSKKREQEFLAGLRGCADALAESLGGTIQWDAPLGEARYG
ncbi:MAG: hypothetical protein IJ705_00700 [Oscillospiraceae bacterium]|nr:hypothetical protein [Oscillospiraceae bacterium]